MGDTLGVVVLVMCPAIVVSSGHNTSSGILYLVVGFVFVWLHCADFLLQCLFDLLRLLFGLNVF